MVVLLSIYYEQKNRNLFNSQVEIYKINKSLNKLKNHQDNLFLNSRNIYLKKSDEHKKLLIEIARLEVLLDSISELKFVKKTDYFTSLNDLKFELEKYNNYCSDVIKINEQIFAPETGINSKLNDISKRIKQEEKYKELDLIKYIVEIEQLRLNLYSQKISIRQFEKNVDEIFQNIYLNKKEAYDKYYLLLFEDALTDYYKNTQLEYTKLNEIGTSYNDGILQYINKQHIKLNDKVIHVENQVKEYREVYYRRILTNFFILIFVVLGLNALFFYYIDKYFNKPWQILEKSLQEISKGKIILIPQLSIVEEYKVIKESLNSMLKNLKEKNETIIELSKRNYNVEIETTVEDEIGKSLLELKDDLLKSQQEALQYQETEENQKWVATGIAKIGAIMRQNTEDIEALTKNVLNEIIEYIGAVQGAIYLYNENKNVLEFTASVSYGKQRIRNHVIEPYEGLLGTILVEKREYYYETVPENYMFLETGLGYTKPNSLFAFPLLFENVIYGVIELASLDKFQEYVRNFLLNLGNEIAITISYTKINVQTKKLLVQSNKQAHELQSNEKLFKKNQDNLKSLLRMTEQRLNEKEDILKIKEQIIQNKVQELIDIQTELSEKEEYIENMSNEYENIKSELENKNKELRERISDLEKRLRDKNV